MQFISHSLKADEHWDEADCLLITISPEYARTLLDLRAKCMAFLREVCEGHYMGHIALPWESDMTAFDYSMLQDKPECAEIVSAYEEAESRNGFAAVPEDFDPRNLGDEYNIARLRGQMIKFYSDGSMRLTSYEKHTGSDLDSEDFDEAFLQKIIDGAETT